MKDIRKLCFLLPFFYALVFGCKNSENGNGKSAYSLSADSLYFSTINQSDTFKKTIFFINHTDTSIRLLRIQSSCGCTQTSFKDSLVSGNDSVPLTIQYIPSVTMDTGKIEKYITIRTNSSPNFASVKIYGHIQKK